MNYSSLKNRNWWKEAVVYQVYPRSFKDSNDDGIGDLQGLISKLDYIKKLGVDLIWLSPMFKSPNDDNGYDISDYRDIMDDFGTMDDFDQLMAELKKRDLKIILDLVVNHCSDEHQWFQEAKKSKDNPYRDYFHWKEGGKLGALPNDWVSFFMGSAWEYEPITQEYYLHLFTKKQPDLNWENPKVREEIYDIMRFWLDKGVAGFRMDVISLISKKVGLPSFPKDFDGHHPNFYGNGPKIHEYLREMNEKVLRHYPEMMTVGEGPGITENEALDYVGEDRKELHTIYHFDHLEIDRVFGSVAILKDWSLVDFKEIWNKWDKAMGKTGWNSVILGNHDFPRMISRFGDAQYYHKESGKLLATLLLSQKGTPYIYQGDEFGMTNVAFKSLKDYDDVWVRNTTETLKNENGDLEGFLSYVHQAGRDNARTPMQWDNEPNAGFSTAKPWLSLNPNYPVINADKAVKDTDSIYHYFRKFIEFRKKDLVWVYGSYKDIDPSHDQIFAYTRTLENTTKMVVLNFGMEPMMFNLPNQLAEMSRTMEFSNYETSIATDSEGVHLNPWQAKVYDLKKMTAKT